jgi:hypothetical protein
MREAGQWCTSYADYPPGPHQTSLALTPLGPSTSAPKGGASRWVLELIINP